MTNEEINLIQSLDGQTCLYASLYSQKMAFSAPTFETIIFNQNSIVTDEDGYSSDFGMQVNVQKIGNQIIITVTDGDSEPTNEIYIFQG